MNLTKELKAFCYSRQCTKNAGCYHSQSVTKDVPRGTFNCPDCQSALMWRKESYRRGTEKPKRKYATIEQKEYFEGA